MCKAEEKKQELWEKKVVFKGKKQAKVSVLGDED